MIAEVNDHDESSDRKARNSVALLSVLTAAFLILLKGGAGWLTGSVSVLASLLDSTMDIFASTINFIAVRAASKPADEDHAYGHGKAESLAGLFQAVVIGISGAFLIAEAVRRLMRPQPTSSEWIGIVTMLIAMAVSAALVFRLRRVAAQTDSPALASDALHYATDIYINGGVLVALVVSAITGSSYADPVISIGIAIYILWSAFDVARDSVNALMDRRLPTETEEQIAEIVRRFHSDGVLGFHDLRTRRSGPGRFVDLHLEIDKTKSFQEAHDVAVKVLRAIERELPRTKVHVHSDPAG